MAGRFLRRSSFRARFLPLVLSQNCLARRQLTTTGQLQPLLKAFDTKPATAAAFTAPSSWYTTEELGKCEEDTVFSNSWLHVGRVDQLPRRGSFFTGEVARQPFIVTRLDSGELRAMYNVCAHHAAIVEKKAEGMASQFTCPYHGWCYRNDGRLVRSTKLSGIENFKAREQGLRPIQVDTCGPFVFINFSATALPPVRDVLAEIIQSPLDRFGRLENAKFIKRVEYHVPSNWKVFCDNYLDGGYHVPIAHKDLADKLNESTYTIRVVKGGTIQEVAASGDSRLGKGALYLFAYPNLMVNRYGPWLESNTCLPVTTTSCKVVFDYFLDEEEIKELEPGLDIERYVREGLAASEKVQREDAELCDIVQRGLTSKGYTAGRYVPSFEHGMHDFHLRLHHDLSSLLKHR